MLDKTSDQYLDYRELENAFWRERGGIFVVPAAMRALATTFLLTQEERYGEAARGILMAIIRNGLADASSRAWGQRTSGWRHGEGHDKFFFALGTWTVFDFCFPLFSPGEVEEVAGYFGECVEISDRSREGDSNQVTNNRGIRGLLATALFAMVAEPFREGGDVASILSRAWIALEKHLFFAFDAQGAPYEGPAYSGNYLGGLALMAHLLQRRGMPNLLFHRAFERFPRYLAYEQIPGMAGVNNLNDAAHPAGSVSGSLFWMNRRGGEIIPWIAGRLDLSPERAGERKPQANPAVRDFLNFLLWWDDSVPVRSPEELGWPDSRCFAVRGVASHRTGWSGNDWLASHFCGRQEILCHRQGDQNHVAFYAGGEHLLVDAGYGETSRDATKAMNRWFGLTEAHNCVLIDGQNQRGVISSPGWGEGEMLEFGNDKDQSWSLGDASTATGADHRIRQSLRKVILKRTGPLPFLLVLDRNERDGKPFCCELLWHTHPDNTLLTHESGGMIRARGMDCHILVFPLQPGKFEVFRENAFGRPRMRVRETSCLSEFATVFIPGASGAPAPKARLETLEEGAYQLTLDSVEHKAVSFRFNFEME